MIGLDRRFDLNESERPPRNLLWRPISAALLAISLLLAAFPLYGRAAAAPTSHSRLRADQLDKDFQKVYRWAKKFYNEGMGDPCNDSVYYQAMRGLNHERNRVIKWAKSGMIQRRAQAQKVADIYKKLSPWVGGDDPPAVKEFAKTMLSLAGFAPGANVVAATFSLGVQLIEYDAALQNAKVIRNAKQYILDEARAETKKLIKINKRQQNIWRLEEEIKKMIDRLEKAHDDAIDDCMKVAKLRDVSKTYKDPAWKKVAKNDIIKVVDRPTGAPLDDITVVFYPDDGGPPDIMKPKDGDITVTSGPGDLVVYHGCHETVRIRVTGGRPKVVKAKPKVVKEGPKGGKTEPKKVGPRKVTVPLKRKKIRVDAPCDIIRPEAEKIAKAHGIDLTRYDVDYWTFRFAWESPDRCELIIRAIPKKQEVLKVEVETVPSDVVKELEKGASGAIPVEEQKKREGKPVRKAAFKCPDTTGRPTPDTTGKPTPEDKTGKPTPEDKTGKPTPDTSGGPRDRSTGPRDRSWGRDVPIEGQAKADGARRLSDPLLYSEGSWGQPYADQWALRNIRWLGSNGASILPEKGNPVVVAVIDTGVDRFHPDLWGATWINEDEIPDNGKDDDGNGYVDDVYGWNFLVDSPDITDDNGHGTVIAGIIAAGVDDAMGIAGVNPWAQIMPIKITNFINKGGSINLAKAIAYAADNGARIINLSVGGKGWSRTVQSAIDYAATKGVLIVAASGNLGINTKDFFPSGMRNVITVASTDMEDKRVNFSNWGHEVDIAAPGTDILSLRAWGTDLLLFERKDYEKASAIVDERYYRVSGSSFSAPFVTGVASLILTRNPRLTAEQVRRMILYSARDIDVPGKDQYTGYGLLDAWAALAADPDFFLEAEISGIRVVKKGGAPVLDVTGTANADQLRAAWVEIGPGENPRRWRKVSRKLRKPVENGPLAAIPASQFKGSPVWIVRLVAEHENGKRREARHILRLRQ